MQILETNHVAKLDSRCNALLKTKDLRFEKFFVKFGGTSAKQCRNCNNVNRLHVPPRLGPGLEHAGPQG
jgi:hypothetical protein